MSISSTLLRYILPRKGIFNRAATPAIPPHFAHLEAMENACRDYFDPVFYLARYRDVRENGIDPLEHYIKYGWLESRDPSREFDTRFYVANFLGGKVSGICPLYHYATEGKKLGYGINELDYLEALIRSADDDVDRLRELLENSKAINEDSQLNKWFKPLFSASYYRVQKDDYYDRSDEECFLIYLMQDFVEYRSAGCPFDEATYRSNAERMGIELPTSKLQYFRHWLKSGMKRGVSPVKWFDPDVYLELNPDVSQYPGPPFEHFLKHGLGEGRRFHKIIQITNSSHELAKTTPRQMGIVKLGDPDFYEQIERNGSFRNSELFNEILAKAARIEPQVPIKADKMPSLVPHWHDADYHNFAVVAEQVQGQYENVVLVPHCKVGGADLVAGLVTNALHASGSTLVLRTERSDWDRPDWFPEEVSAIDLSKWLAPVYEPMRKRYLYEIVRATGAKNVFNVNSLVGFQMLATFGRRMSEFTQLHNYYFCADRDELGGEAGYPISFFANIITHLDTAIFDTKQLAETLSDRYQLPEDIRERVQTIYTPAVSDSSKPPLVDAQIKSSGDRKRPLILWAGRFDRQKRFDLFLEIAAAMPEVDFKCWGVAVLDAMPSLDDIPANVEMNKPFKGYDDLPLENCDGYLYTSEWDGLPTILIELGARGMPIVASGVGGVPELVNDKTGWSLDEDATVADYVSAIRELIGNPELRREKATALQSLVAERHTKERYFDALQKLTSGR